MECQQGVGSVAGVEGVDNAKGASKVSMMPRVSTRCRHGVETVSRVSLVPRVLGVPKMSIVHYCATLRSTSQGRSSDVQHIAAIEAAVLRNTAQHFPGQLRPSAQSHHRASSVAQHLCHVGDGQSSCSLTISRQSLSLWVIRLPSQSYPVMAFNLSTSKYPVHPSRSPTITVRLLSTKYNI
jgi:hypothetical protein